MHTDISFPGLKPLGHTEVKSSNCLCKQEDYKYICFNKRLSIAFLLSEWTMRVIIVTVYDI